MATDLIASISRIFTPDALAKIASALGVNRGAVQQAVTAGIPAILAGLTGAAAKPGGAQRIASVLMQQPPGALDDVRNALGGSEQTSVAEHGAGILSKLLGGDLTRSVTAAIEEYAGLRLGQGNAILGLIAPVALGVLGQEQRASGLDAGGVAGLLAGQKDTIARALPPGLADELSGSGILDSLGDALGDTEAASAAGSRLRDARVPLHDRSARPPVADTAGMGASQWAFALAAVAAIGALLWFLSGAPQPEQVAVQSAPAIPVEGRAVSAPQVSAPDLSQRVGTTIDGFKTALQGITDESSAAAMLPKLRETVANLDDLGALAAKLPVEDQRKVATLVSGAMPAVNELCDKVLALPTVAGVARPLVETVRAKLGSIAGT